MAIKHNGSARFFSDLLHLTKNFRSKLVTEDTNNVVRIFSFFVNMKKNEKLEMLQD